MFKIIRTESGFVERTESAEVEYLECDFAKEICTVHFYHKPRKELQIPCSSFNLQYGIPVSEDGSQLFFSDWDHGLWAYDLDSGEIGWYSASKHLTYLFVDGPHLLAVQQNKALFCFDAQTGAVLREVKSTSIQDAFRVGGKHLLVESIAGYLSAVDMTDLSVYKRYSRQAVNPYKCLSFMLHGAELCDNVLRITGQEGAPRQPVPDMDWPHKFERVIDPGFISVK